MKLWESLIPFDEAVATIPEDNFVEVEGDRVHAPVSGRETPLVLLHGIAAAAFSFRLLRPLLDGSFQTLAIDLSGFGYSQRPRELSAYRPEEQVDRVIEVMKKRGIERADFLGHSYGAVLVSLLASRHPERVGRIILLSPASEFKPPPWYLRNAVALWGCYFATRMLLSKPEKFRKIFSRSYFRRDVFDEETAERYRRALLIDGLRSSFVGYAQALGGAFPKLAWERLTVRTLVIAGREDEIVPWESCEKLSRRISGAEFETIENCGHSAPEEQPEELASLIQRFLQHS